MPCGDYGYEDEISDLRKEKKILTRVACDLAANFPGAEVSGHLRKETRDWIVAHNKADEIRRRRERLERENVAKRRLALRKLTDEERRLLGLLKSSS